VRALWLPDKLRDFAVEVRPLDGWQTRGGDTFNPGGVIAHHTATPGWSEPQCDALLIDGRKGLRGPLAQLGLDYAGRAVVVASGSANHAGSQTNREWRGLHGNSRLIGIEGYSGGTEDWTNAQRDAYPKVLAACLSGIGKDESWINVHRNISTIGKPDPAGLTLAWLQEQAGRELRRNFPEEDDMTAAQAEQLERVLALALNTNHMAVVEIPARLSAVEARIVELEREFQAPGATGTKGQAIRQEIDLLRRDMRKIGEKLGFNSES
jgi:hypothetical protein